MPYLTITDDAAELFLGTEGVELDEKNPENRFGRDWVARVADLADEAVAANKPLIITATGKFFTNGLDTDHLMSGAEPANVYIDAVHDLYTKILTLPVPTIAAVNGHAFGAGAMLVECADYRIMRTERGFWSLPEVLLGMPFPHGMAAILRDRVPNATLATAMLTARRYGAAEALAGGIVDEIVDVDQLLDRAREVARERAQFTGPNITAVKQSLHLHALAELAIATPAG